jgi:hypothetical protein
MLRDAADDAYYLLSKERRLELAGIFCQGPAATQHAIAEQPIHLQIWTACCMLMPKVLTISLVVFWGFRNAVYM